MGDLIDRQTAIDALHMHLMYRMGTDSNKKRLDEWINNLPSAQPERKTGKWLDDEDDPESVRTDGYCGYCSVCKEMSEYLTAYCGNCGADMRGTWDEA